MKYRIAFALLCVSCTIDDCEIMAPQGETAPESNEKSEADDADFRRKSCIEKVRRATSICIVNSVKVAARYQIERCMAASKRGIRACSYFGAPVPTCEPERALSSNFDWVDDLSTPVSMIDCPDDTYGPRYIQLQKEYGHGVVCIRNELTGEIF